MLCSTTLIRINPLLCGVMFNKNKMLLHDSKEVVHDKGWETCFLFIYAVLQKTATAEICHG